MSETDTAPEVEAQDVEASPSEAPSIEEQASLVGWNPDGPKSAEEFLARNQEHKGLLRAENEKLFGKIGELEGTVKAMAQHLEKVEARGIKQGYDRAMAEQKQLMRKAVDDADQNAFDEAARRLETLEKQKAEAKPDPIKPPQVNPLQKAVAEHMRSHGELFDTKLKTQAWLEEVQFQGKRGLSIDAAFKAADKAIVDQFNMKRSLPGPEGGDTAGATVSSFDKLPKEAKDAYARFAKEIPGYTKEEYLESYNQI